MAKKKTGNIKASKNNHYYSQKKIRDAAEKIEIEEGYPTEKIIKNTYVHTGIYNFNEIAKMQNEKLPVNELKKKMKSVFNQEIEKSIRREQQIYKLLKIKNLNNLENELSLNAFGEEVWDKLNLYSLVEELVSTASERKEFLSLENGDKKLSPADFNKILQGILDKRLSELDEDYNKIYSPLLQGFRKNNAFKVNNSKEVYLSVLEKNPSTFFNNFTSYQGDVGEFATLLNFAINSSISDQVLLTELFGKDFNSDRIKTVVKGGKSDISFKKIGFSVKNYRQQDSGLYNLSLHSGKQLQNAILTDFKEILNYKNFGLRKILQENNYSWNILSYFSYMFANVYALSKVGGYESKTERTKGNRGKIVTIEKNWDNYPFIKNFIKYSTIYWIGEKILNSLTQKGQNTDPVAFLVINKKIIPMSKILISIRDDLDSAVIDLNFSGNAKFNANVLRQEKYRVIKNLKAKRNRKKGYPDPLLKIGSAVGKNIVNNVAFKMEMNINLNNF